MTLEALKKICADDQTREIAEIAHAIGMDDGRWEERKFWRDMIDRILPPAKKETMQFVAPDKIDDKTVFTC